VESGNGIPCASTQQRFALIDKTRKQRKAIKEHRKAREQAQKRQNES